MSGTTTTSSHARLSGLALAGLLLGLAALFTVVTGPLALYFGYRGLYAVNTSDGRLAGRTPAVIGMILGALVTLAGAIGLFALAIAKLRSESEVVECANNMRVIGLAVNLYQGNHGEVFPHAVVPLADQPPERHASWFAAILPYLNAKANGPTKWEQLSVRLDLNIPWDAPANREALNTFVPFYQCPGYPLYDPIHNPGLTQYVGVTGIGDDAAFLPKGNIRAGFFGYSRDLTLDDVEKIGSSHKMMVLETTEDIGPWIAGGLPTVRGVGFDSTFLSEQGATVVGLSAGPNGDCAAPLLAALQTPRPREPTLIGPGRPFGGLHPGGLNVLWADGSVRFVSDTIPPRTFRLQATLSDDVNALAELP